MATRVPSCFVQLMIRVRVSCWARAEDLWRPHNDWVATLNLSEICTTHTLRSYRIVGQRTDEPYYLAWSDFGIMNFFFLSFFRFVLPLRVWYFFSTLRFVAIKITWPLQKLSEIVRVQKKKGKMTDWKKWMRWLHQLRDANETTHSNTATGSRHSKLWFLFGYNVMFSAWFLVLIFNVFVIFVFLRYHYFPPFLFFSFLIYNLFISTSWFRCRYFWFCTAVITTFGTAPVLWIQSR